MPAPTPAEFQSARNLDDIYALLPRLSIANGWAKPEPSLWARPRQGFVPAHWPYLPAKAALEAAGRYINTELAERRNLILVNPVPGNTYPTVRTLVCAYQMVKAGETAKSHRHTANALRLVLDTRPGAFTIVDGRKIPMEPGDVLLTPNWCWHAHANESRADAYWMDVLDVPTVHLLNPMFFEHHAEGIEPATAVAPDSPMRFAFSDIVSRLAAAPEAAPGVRQIDLTPSPGSPAMATIRLTVSRIDAGSAFELPSTTASSIMAVMQGEGTMSGEGRSFAWSRGDALACPAGSALAFAAGQASYLLRCTDEPVLSALGWLRPIPPA